MKRVTVMAWDTATAWTSAAIVRVGEDGSFDILVEFELEGGPSHSQILPPQIEALLKSAGLSPVELDLLAVGRGPGSFTGLRTGLSLAKGLAMGAGRPLMGISTLETLAASMIFEEGAALAAPVIDARHLEIFTALYRASKAGGLDLECLLPPQPVSPAGFSGLMESAAPGGAVSVAGPALGLVREFLAGHPDLSAGPAVLPPSAVMLARLAAARLKLNGQGLSANPPLPMYIRQPDIRQSGIVLK
ncbi:tRNA (adenosine(37)-N6)-threonylcarbamoyltransferase complex dimerization subunit type 1 TsaB [Deltaproteobacteria bacterium Smac51]|nr:tRNA (adenosine(37)-N6)-threonylcarbamoyltransferase complex dimerization subunit type 1 TsaB [Deltaproteobacteria bacterium Smac51]